MNNCQELFSRCDHLEDTVAEEASALEILNNSEANSFNLMASANKGFKGDMAEIRQVKNSTQSLYSGYSGCPGQDRH